MISVLLIDDSPEEQELITELLQDANVYLEVFSGGRDAVPRASEYAFDCALLDLRLDGEDGLEVLADIQSVRPDLPVIVLTGQGSEQAATNAFLAGAAYYLPKRDLTAKTLHTAIDRVIDVVRKEKELKSKHMALERSNRLDAVGQLAAGIAHDFNNQLGALRFCIEFLKTSAVTDPSKEKIDTALTIIEESKNLAGRLVALSRQGDLLAKSISLRETFADLRALAAVSTSSQVRLEIAEPDSDLTALCDPGQLLNVLLNLTMNANEAIKSTGAGGTISVMAHHESEKVRITVRDNGHGMSEDVLTKCTDPFFTTKRDKNGTGLGLAMAQGFANDYAGELQLQSSEGEGTEIVVILPKGRKISTEENGRIQKTGPSKPDARILLVEDNFPLARMMGELLKRRGYTVVSAANGEDALEVIWSDPTIDLIITDIKMPGMDGFELGQCARQKIPQVQIIYVTGYADNPEHQDQKLLGPILQKPIEPDVFLGAIEKALS